MSKAQPAQAGLPDAFLSHVEAALERFHDTEWLGEESPLSAPYLMGQRLRASPGHGYSATQRGQALQQALRLANDWLKEQGRDSQESSRLIAVSYLQPTPLTVEAAAAVLGMSRAGYYRHRAEALRRFSAALIRQVNPALRLDRPAQPALVVGRDALQEDCLQALLQGRTVALCGPAGSGKTTLGAAVAARLSGRRVFWFTFIPRFNDHLRSLLFAVGYFCWQQGAANLWGQLLAEKGSLSPALMLGLLRADLAALADSPPITCFDEVDLLRPAEVEAHAQIAGLLSSLRGACACLFMGQQLTIEADRSLLLEGLDEAAVGQYLSAAGVDLRGPDRHSLLSLTDGNPRLLELFVSLHRAGDPIPDNLPRLNTAPSVEFLLARIRQHLRPEEEALLENLSVFRQSAPADAWPADSSARLVRLRLASYVEPGGIALQTALRFIVYERMRPEAKRQAHQQAAGIRAARAEYTEAAYHHLQAGQVRPALWLWHAHRSDEINQGRGALALALFEQIDGAELAGEDRDILALILAELGKLAGQEPRADLREVEWQSPLLRAQGLRLQGDLAELKGQTDAAILAYQDGLATVENLLAEKSLFDKNLGWAYLRQGGASLDLAWQKACLARFEAERLQGDIQSRRGNFEEAEACYREALASAQAFGLVEGQAKTHNHLATLLARQGRLDAALEHRSRAIALFEQIGNQVHLAGAKLNMSFHYNLSGQQQAVLSPAAPAFFPIFEQARQVAGEALALFERIGQPLGQIIAVQNLAEACLYLGRLDEAARYAQRVIESRTPSVLPDGLRTLGEVHLAQGDLPTAESLIRESIQRSQDNADPYLEAYGWRALARVYRCGARQAETHDALSKALALFESLDLPMETARTQATALRPQAV